MIYKHLLAQYECEQIAEIESCDDNRPVCSFGYGGERLAFYLRHIGSALAGGTVTEVNHLVEASRLIMFGFCGSLDRTGTDGRFIIPTQAYRGEGLSFYFAKAQRLFQNKNTEVMENIFSERKIPFITDRVWTTDSMLCETVNLVNRHRQDGCIAVEMEITGVQASDLSYMFFCLPAMF